MSEIKTLSKFGIVFRCYQSLDPASSFAICLIKSVEVIILEKVRCSLRIGKRSRWRSRHWFPTGKNSETYTRHNPFSSSQEYTFTVRLFICSTIGMFALWLEMGLACYTTVYHKNVMNKRDRESSRFSLHFLRLERVWQADTSGPKALFIFRVLCV